MTIPIGSDHAGFEYKEKVIDHLKELGHIVEDFGTYSAESTDYADFAHPVAQSIENGQYDKGIVICGSGQGVCMTVNKHKGVRGALVWNSDIAQLARQHNNANVLCLPARFISVQQALHFVDLFLNTAFEGGRHERRIDKISC